MFSQLRARVASSLAYLTNDEFDKLLTEQVQAGTSDELISPDTNINLTIVDMVNHNPATMSEKLWKILRRTVQANSTNAKVLILSLTILDTCIKSCSAPVYHTLAVSELWDLLVKMAADNSATRVDSEVRDKILTLVEDYSCILPQREYTESFERLLEAGVDFPVRQPGERDVPVLNPPQPSFDTSHLTPEQHQELLTAAALEGQRAVNQARPQARGGPAPAPPPGPDVDPFAGMSEEDKAAIKKAMEELDAEAEAFRQAEAVAAAAAIAEQMRVQDERQHLAQQAARMQQQRDAAAAARQRNLRDLPAPREEGEGEGVDEPLLNRNDEYLNDPALLQGHPQPYAAPQGGALPYLAPPAPPPPPSAAMRVEQPERSFDETLQVISNTVGLLNDLLGDPSNNPQESFVSELAQQCVSLQRKLERFINGLEEEDKLMNALTQHEALRAVVAKYDEALARAVGAQAHPHPPSQGQGGDVAIGLPVNGMAAAAVAASVAAAAGNNAPARLAIPGAAGPNFSLLGDDDDGDDGSIFAPQAKAVAKPATLPPPASDNLLDLLDVSLIEPATSHTAPVSTAGASTEAPVASGIDFSGLTVHEDCVPAPPAPQPAAASKSETVDLI